MSRNGERRTYANTQTILSTISASNWTSIANPERFWDYWRAISLSSVRCFTNGERWPGSLRFQFHSFLFLFAVVFSKVTKFWEQSASSCRRWRRSVRSTNVLMWVVLRKLNFSLLSRMSIQENHLLVNLNWLELKYSYPPYIHTCAWRRQKTFRYGLKFNYSVF